MPSEPGLGSTDTGEEPDGALLKLESISKSFSQHGMVLHALTEVSLSVLRGEFLVIVGPSGCGKTTLLKIMAGLVKSTGGTVERAVSTQRQGGIGMVFQEPVLLPWRSVLDNIMLPAEILKIRDSKPRAMELLRQQGLERFAKSMPYQLSGGMQHRVAICRALLPDPPILLLDEPFGGLDAISRERQSAHLLDMWATTGKTVAMVTHSIQEAVFMADRIVIMRSRPGRVTEVMRNDLPRPRTTSTFEHPLFASYITHVRQQILDATDAG